MSETSDVQQLTPYEMLGGEAPLRQLVNRFYEIMDADPRVMPLRQMHRGDMALIREKLFEFLSGWLGGPSLFIEKYGHPMLRARHMPFAVDEDARDQWLLCMYTALDEMRLEPALRDHLEEAFFRTADLMRNR